MVDNTKGHHLELRKKDSNQAFLEIVYIFIAPVVLIYIEVIPHSWRLLVLFACSLLIMSIIRYQRWSRAELGLLKIFQPKAVLAYGLFALIGVIAIVYYAKRFGFEPIVITDWQNSWRLLLFFIPLSILQEVAYRGFLTQRLIEISASVRHRVLLNALLFTLLHIIYPYGAITLPVAFLGGIIFAALYEKYPSLVLACIAHAVLNFTAVMFGIFS